MILWIVQRNQNSACMVFCYDGLRDRECGTLKNSVGSREFFPGRISQQEILRKVQIFPKGIDHEKRNSVSAQAFPKSGPNGRRGFLRRFFDPGKTDIQQEILRKVQIFSKGIGHGKEEFCLSAGFQKPVRFAGSFRKIFVPGRQTFSRRFCEKVRFFPRESLTPKEKFCLSAGSQKSGPNGRRGFLRRFFDRGKTGVQPEILRKV